GGEPRRGLPGRGLAGLPEPARPTLTVFLHAIPLRGPVMDRSRRFRAVLRARNLLIISRESGAGPPCRVLPRWVSVRRRSGASATTPFFVCFPEPNWKSAKKFAS